MSAGQIGFPRLDFFEVTSTLDIARRLAARGAAHGTLITAVHQTAGRGRRGAAWQDRSDENAHGGQSANSLLTFILRPETDELPLSEAWRVSFIASLACVRALRQMGYARAQVKWPNDLVIGGAKVGGLLVESFAETIAPDHAGPTPKRVYLAGIGINVGQASFPDSDHYTLAPTSLILQACAADSAPNAVVVADTVAAKFSEEWRRHLGSGVALIEAWRAYQMTGQLQSGVELATGVPLSGRYVDVDEQNGAAWILVDGGSDPGALAAIAPMP